MVRTVHTWRILGEDLVGTGHVPTPGLVGGLAGASSAGLLILNPGSAMRSGNSDLSARIGDRLALRGFPVFRFDLPGLGDSSGPTPVDLDAFWSEIVNGRHDEATVALIERIQLELGHERVVVGGLCSAVLPSVRALGRPGVRPAGLLLLEPNFLLKNEVDVGRGAESRGAFDWSLDVVRRGLSVLGLDRGSSAARMARRLSSFPRNALPRDVHRSLIERWQASLAQGVHTLVVVAAGQGADAYLSRILESMPDRAPGAVTFVQVPRTNHLFTEGAGREAVLCAVERWMVQCFDGKREPLRKSADRGAAQARS